MPAEESGEDRALLLFRHELGWRDCYYVSRNIGRARARAPELDAELLAEVAARNQLDIELYAWARRRFAERIAALSPPIDEQLARFQERNRRFAALRRPAIEFYDRTKERLGL